MADADTEFIRELVRRNRYLTLATTDGVDPWIAPLEYLSDGELNLYFFSPAEATHSKHLNEIASAAFSIFDAVQPDYEPAPVMRISGVQATALVKKMEPPYPDQVANQIEEWKLPMPPYVVYQISPQRWFMPVIRDGVNERIEVDMS